MHNDRMSLYVFDDADEALSQPPTSARRALELTGENLSLAGWQSLSPADRRALVAIGVETNVDVNTVRAVTARAHPTSVPASPRRDPDSQTPPRPLVDALGESRALTEARWRALRALDRYALDRALTVAPSQLASVCDEILQGPLSHLTPAGEVRMVGVGGKTPTHRRAVATAVVQMRPETLARLSAGDTPKGDVLASARIAGIQAAKKTWELIPLCHPIALSGAQVQIETDGSDPERGVVRIRATVEAIDRTGVEMEALVAATTAALTIYDMLKAIDRWMTITDVGLLEKSGGRSGHLERGAPR
jgi:cyclic pyranopterin phosphate synthase